jgi:hypothetical protein
MRSDLVDWRPLVGAVAAKTTPGTACVYEMRRVECRFTEPLFTRLLRKLFPDQRKEERLLEPPLVGYLGTARSTSAYQVGDISPSGFCLLTRERWTQGTEMPITLARTSVDDLDPEFFTVQATVVRNGKNGVAFSILLSEEESRAADGNPLKVKWASKPEVERFLNRLKEAPNSPVVSAKPNPAAAIPNPQSAGMAATGGD